VAALAPAVRVCGGGRWRLVGKSRKRDSGHGSTRVWPGRKRARRGTFLGAQVGEKGAGEGRTAAARGTAAAHGTVATASNRACGKAGKGKRGRRGSSPKAELRRQLTAIEEWQGGHGGGGRGAAAKAVVRDSVCEARGGGCGLCGS
jgi:hypothetical protein